MKPKSAMITGPSRGIGRATALAYAARGCDVVLVGRPSQRLTEVAEQIEATGRAARIVPCDLATPDAIEVASESVLGTGDVPDVLIHNAGVVKRGTLIEETPPNEWDEVLNVNLRAPFLLTRALLPAMKKRSGARVLFVSSISATIGCARAASYAASKWGLVGLMKSLAEELRGTGVVTAALLPGSVDTDMLKGSGFTPAMTAEHVANTLVYLGLDAPAAIHGSPVEFFG